MLLRLRALRPRILSMLFAVSVLGGAAHAITGVCPDGSIFIVKQAADIPCPQAKQVDSNHVPPLNPEFLPRPYGWEVFNRQSDPNNPYNLVDSIPPTGAAAPGVGAPSVNGAERAIVGADSPAPERAVAGASPPDPQPSAAATRGSPPPERVALASPGREDDVVVIPMGLSDRELMDLASIVDLRQNQAPATLVRLDAAGERLSTLRVARSAAFEAHVRHQLALRGSETDGSVVIFRATSDARDEFRGNLMFVQGHVAFHPDKADPAQFGVLDGELGPLRPETPILGYAVLPRPVDLAQPLDVYWDDRRITAVLQP